MSGLQGLALSMGILAIVLGLISVKQSIDKQTNMMLCIAAVEHGIPCKKAKPHD